MFSAADNHGYREVLPGIHLKTIAHGEKTLLAEFRLAAHAVLPPHSHPHEQTGYLVSGAMTLTIGAETFAVAPGDSWCIPGMVEHRAVALQDSVAIEVFSPVRAEYLPR